MTVSEAIVTRLLALSPVTALVGTRVRVLTLRQSEIYPAIRVQRISEIQPMHLRGAVMSFTARVQVDSYGQKVSGVDPYAHARNVDAAAYGDGAGSGLCAFVGSVGSPAFTITGVFPDNVREDFDAEELNIVRIMREYVVRWKS